MLAVAAALIVAGCVTSKVEQMRQAPRQVVVAKGEAVVVLSRRHRGDRETELSFSNCLTRSLESRRLPIYPDKAFVDAMFPWLEPRTAPMSSDGMNNLLDDPVLAARVRETGVRFMIWIEGETDTIDSAGSMSCAILPVPACLGFGWWEKRSKYEVSVWDVRNRSAVGKVAVNASGTSYVPALIVPVPMIARTEAAACDGVAAQVGELLGPRK
jgi:hypothetical protein